MMPALFAAADLDLFRLVSTLLGGLALFLFGMTQMTDGLKAAAGDGLRAVLAKLTRNRFAAAFTGAFITAVCQSSSVTTVLLVGFISAGLMTLEQSVGVIMGANIGSTVTAQLIAFKITAFALPMVTLGFVMQFAFRRELVRALGSTVLGMGLIFYGMGLMSEATSPLRDFPPFTQAMQNMHNPVLAILVSAGVTAVIQSSAATTGIVIVLAGQGFISLEAGIALALGANIGTCVTAVLAAIGKPRPAVRAAAVHVLFNVVGVLIWLPLLTPFAEVVRAISPSSPADLDAAARLAIETPRQIANAHTMFNVVNTLLFIWFTGVIAKIVVRLVPDRPVTGPQPIQPEFLDPVYLDTPSLALDRIGLEIGRLGQCVRRMLQAAPHAVTVGAQDELHRVRDMDEDVDILYAAILDYMRGLAGRELSESQSRRLETLLTAARDLESMGDLIETNLVAQGLHRIEYHLEISHSTLAVIQPLCNLVTRSLDDVLESLAEDDIQPARVTIGRKTEVDQLASLATEHLSQRLLADEPNRVHAFSVEADIVSHWKRLYYYTKRIAKALDGSTTAEPLGPDTAEGET